MQRDPEGDADHNNNSEGVQSGREPEGEGRMNLTTTAATMASIEWISKIVDTWRWMEERSQK